MNHSLKAIFDQLVGLPAQEGNLDLFVAKYEAPTITAVEEAPEGVPGRLVRVEAYPNPSQGRATIRYEVAAPGRVRLAVYDVLGRAVAVLVENVQQAGRYEAAFEARGLASGVYVYRLETAGQVTTDQLIEHLCGLSRLPERGFRFFAVPVKIRHFGTFPVRAFGLVGS